MSEHLSAEQQQQYLRGKLPAEQLLVIDEHLAGCESCRNGLAGDARLAASVSGLRADFQHIVAAPPTHLTWEQLSALADNRLDAVEQELAESHLKICRACTTEFTELRQFAEHLTNFPVQEFAPPSPPSFWRKAWASLGFRQHPSHSNDVVSWSLALRFAGVAAVLAIILWGGLSLWRAKNANVNEPEIASRETATPTPATTPSTILPETPTPAPLLALTVGGTPVTLEATGQVTGINFASSADEKLVANTLRSGQLETPVELKQLSTAASGLMGKSSDETFRLLSPTGRIVATTRPVLQWQALRGASEYIVTIANPQTNFVLSSEPLKTTQWKPPQPLLRGQTYTWQVTALKEGTEIKSPAPDVPDAQFRILSQPQFEEVTRAEKAYVGNPLMLGVVYARSGLMREAEAQFNALRGSNPQSAIVRQLLQAARKSSIRN